MESRHAKTSPSHNEDIGMARKLVIKGASDSGCQISSGETVVVAIRGSRGSVRPSHSTRPPWAATNLADIAEEGNGANVSLGVTAGRDRQSNHE